MTENQLPDHVAVFIAAIKDNPALTEGATEAVGDQTGTEAANAAAEYYRSQGYTISAEELFALKAASKGAAGEELNDEELQAISGGEFGFRAYRYSPDRPTPLQWWREQNLGDGAP